MASCCLNPCSCAAGALLTRRPQSCRKDPCTDTQVPPATEATALFEAVGANDEEDVDVLISSGLALPAIFQTRFRRWAMLIVFCLVNSFATGPMMMFPTLEPILIEEKVFEGPDQVAQLSSVYSIAIAFGLLGTFPIGILYDTYGPRWIAVVFTVGCAIFSAGMGFAIKFQSLNWMMYVAYPLAVQCGVSKMNGGYGWHWLLPESQNTVNSFSAAIQTLSDSLVMVVIWLHKQYGISLWTYYWALCVLSVATAILNICIVPSKKQHLAYAGAILTARKSNEWGYGATDHEGDAELGKQEPIKTSGWRWWDDVKGVRATFRNFPVENALFVCGSLCLFMFAYFCSVNLYPFYAGMFGKAEADIMLNAYSVVFGCFGGIFILLMGRFADWVSLQDLIIANTLIALVGSGLVVFPTVPCQFAFQFVLTLDMSVYSIAIYRFCMVYAPVRLFGSYSGLLIAFMGVFQLCFNAATLSMGPPTVHLIQGVTVSFGVLSAVFFAALFMHWRWKPPPPVGSVTCFEAGVPEEEEYGSPEIGDGGWF